MKIFINLIFLVTCMALFSGCAESLEEVYGSVAMNAQSTYDPYLKQCWVGDTPFYHQSDDGTVTVDMSWYHVCADIENGVAVVGGASSLRFDGSIVTEEDDVSGDDVGFAITDAESVAFINSSGPDTVQIEIGGVDPDGYFLGVFAVDATAKTTTAFGYVPDPDNPGPLPGSQTTVMDTPFNGQLEVY